VFSELPSDLPHMMTTYIPQRFALLRGGGDKQAMAGRRAGRRRRVARAGSAGVEQHTLALAFARGETFFFIFFSTLFVFLSIRNTFYSHCSYLFGTRSIPTAGTKKKAQTKNSTKKLTNNKSFQMFPNSLCTFSNPSKSFLP